MFKRFQQLYEARIAAVAPQNRGIARAAIATAACVLTLILASSIYQNGIGVVFFVPVFVLVGLAVHSITVGQYERQAEKRAAKAAAKAAKKKA